MNRIRKPGNRNLSLILAIMFIANLSFHYFENILEKGSTFSSQYLCWFLLFFYSCLTFRSFRTIHLLILAILMVNSFLPLVFGTPWSLDIIQIIAVWCSYFFSCCICYKRFSQKDIIFIYKTIVGCGCVVCAYAILDNFSLFLSMVKGEGDTGEYVSFLRQRNIFAAYCYLSSIPALYQKKKKKEKLFLLLFLFFGIQIFLTTSRNALLCYGLLAVISFYMKTKNKLLIYFCLILLPIVIYSIFGGFDSFYDRFRHETSDGTDSSMIRFVMWLSCFDFISNNNAWIWGLGIGSAYQYLTPLFNLGSSHNMYIDVIFGGGIIFLLVLVIPLIYSCKCILKNEDEAYKITMVGGIVSYILYGFFEAGMTLFVATFFSVTSTLLFVMIPLNYTGCLPYNKEIK